MRKANSTRVSVSQGPSSAAGAPARPAVTVLHIDDDPNDAALLSAAVHRAGVGFLVENVEDGDRAIAYLSGTGQYADRQRFPLPALILLDLKMPRADGLEVLKWIRSSACFSGTQVLVLSGSELQEDIRNAYATGANSYLVKPIGFEALVSLMRNINAFWLKNGPPASLGPEASGSSLSA
jgi:CheY-like chemotaxis protein